MPSAWSQTHSGSHEHAHTHTHTQTDWSEEVLDDAVGGGVRREMGLQTVMYSKGRGVCGCTGCSLNHSHIDRLFSGFLEIPQPSNTPF